MLRGLIFLIIPLYGFPFERGGVKIDVSSSTKNAWIVEFSLETYSIDEKVIDGKTYSVIKIPEFPNLLKRGYPSLPVIAKSLAIPPDAEIGYRILKIESEKISVNPVIPSKGNLYRNQDPDRIPYTFGKVYNEDTYFPSSIIELGKPYILRDYRGISFRIYPIRYNGKRREIEVVKRMTVEFYVKGKSFENVKSHFGRVNGWFRPIYKNHFINLEQAKYDTLNEDAGSILVITTQEYYNAILPYVRWKRQKGFYTRIALYPDSTGSGNTNIQNYISNEYYNNGLTFVLLVGDIEDIPSKRSDVGTQADSAADPFYGCVEGNDYYPDLFVGRFSCDDTNQVKTMVYRTIQYEKNPDPAAEWYHMATGVASDEGSPADSERANWLRDTLLASTYTLVDRIYQPNGNATQISSALNEGRSLVNYIGHGDVTYWASVYYDISDINALTNTSKLPAIISVACLNGVFSKECFGEAWLRSTNGSYDQPTGAIAIEAASISQSWVPPTVGQREAVNLLAHFDRHTFGGIVENGNCYMIDVYGNPDGVEIFETWIIFGDPSVQLFTDTPAPLTVSHASTIVVGATSFTVDAGIEGALCALYDSTTNTLIGRAYTDASGGATITFSPLSSPGELKLTVTAFNHTPYITNIQVIAPNGPYLSYAGNNIDDSSGNNNGRLNPGETINLTVKATNNGSDPGNGVYGILTSSSSLISITVDSSYYGHIGVNDTVPSLTPYIFSISSDAEDGQQIAFTVVFHDSVDSTWSSDFSLTVYAPHLEYISKEIDPTGDHRIDPGESNVPLYVTIKNNGGDTGTGIKGYISTADPYLTIEDDSASFPDIPPGDSSTCSTDPFVVSASPGTPEGHQASINLVISNTYGVDTFQFAIRIGGPDTLLYEDFEDGMPSDWVVNDGNADGVSWVVGTTPDISTYTPPDYETQYAYYSDDDAGSGAPQSTPGEDFITPAVYSLPYDSLVLSYAYGWREYGTDVGPDYYGVFMREFTNNSWGNWQEINQYPGPDDISGWDTIRVSAKVSADSIQFMWRYYESYAEWAWACAVDNILLLGYGHSTTGIERESKAPGLYIKSNLVTNKISLSFGVPLNGNLRLKIYDISGRKVYEKVFKTGTLKTTIDVTGYPAGIYFLKTKGDLNLSKRILILR